MVQTRWRSGLGNLGPFIANYTVQATPATGVASTASPSSRSGRQTVDVELHLSFDIDLGAVLPEHRLPSASIEIPGAQQVKTPPIRLAWPTVTVRVSHRDRVIGTHEPSANSASLLAAIAMAVSDGILDVPFGSPLLAVVLDGVLASIGIEGATSFLQPIVSSLTSADVVPALDPVAVVDDATRGIDTVPDDYLREGHHALAAAAWA